MTDFAKALQRVEELLKEMEDVEGVGWDYRHASLLDLLDENAEEIVQLGRVAAELRKHGQILSDEYAGPFGQVEFFTSSTTYDELMGGDK
jgi:hypothetical protein